MHLFVFMCTGTGAADCEKAGSGVIIWRMVRSELFSPGFLKGLP